MNTVSANTRPEPIDWHQLARQTPGTPLQQSGLEQGHYQSEYLDLRELRCTTLLRLHSLLATEALRTALAPGTIALPAEVNQSLGQDPSVLCLAPGEWLLFSEFRDFSQLSGLLSSALDAHHTAVLDLSAAFTVFRLTGDATHWLLNKLCGLDIRHHTVAETHCARTRLQHAGVLLHRHRPGGQIDHHVLDLIIDRSLALYSWRLLLASIPHAEQLAQLHGPRQ